MVSVVINHFKDKNSEYLLVIPKRETEESLATL